MRKNVVWAKRKRCLGKALSLKYGKCRLGLTLRLNDVSSQNGAKPVKFKIRLLYLTWPWQRASATLSKLEYLEIPDAALLRKGVACSSTQTMHPFIARMK